MRKKMILILISSSALLVLLSGCSASVGPADTMSSYFNALAAKDGNTMSLLSCADYASQSQQLLDSFTAVDIKLADLACTELENDGTTATVNCVGTIIATYGSEDQELDISKSNYELVQQKGEWLVCGQK